MTRTTSTVVLPLLIVLLKDNHYAAADFGLPTTVAGGAVISSNANSINYVLNSLNQNLRRFNPDKQSVHLRSSSEKITKMAQKIADLGKLITANVSKAASDRSTPVKELFNSLQGSYERMSQYLKADAMVSMDSLNTDLGDTLTVQLENALDGVSQAIANVTTITETFEGAISRTLQAANGRPVTRGTINDNIPSDLTTSMSKALVQIKEQTAVLSKVIENVLKNIAFVDSYLVRVNATALSLEQKVNSTLFGMIQQYPTEASTIVKRYYTSHNIFKTEISNAISSLSVFCTNATLQTLVDGFSEAYTKTYYYLYHRNQADVDAIQKAYNEIVSNIERSIQELNTNLYTDVQQIAVTVGFQYLSQNPKFDACFNRHNIQFMAVYTNINNGITNCLGSEKNRMGRLPDVVDRMLRLTDANTEDIAFNIETCAAYEGFESSPTTYGLAVACLNTTLNHTGSLQQLIGQGYDVMLQLHAQEVASSRFRIGYCLDTRRAESVSLIESLHAEVEQCLNGETTRRNIEEPEEQVIDLTATEVVEDVTTEEGESATADDDESALPTTPPPPPPRTGITNGILHQTLECAVSIEKRPTSAALTKGHTVAYSKILVVRISRNDGTIDQSSLDISSDPSTYSSFFGPPSHCQTNCQSRSHSSRDSSKNASTSPMSQSDESLWKRLLLFLEQHEVDYLFWPDLASCHYTNSTKQYSGDGVQRYSENGAKEIIPANTPELRSIKKYWPIVKHILKKKDGTATNLKDFKQKWNLAAKKVGTGLVQKRMGGVRRKVLSMACGKKED
ncbi:uncharacterized protein LOC135703547 [Ochlerotatus camptorhynchus]|uniref:uncharacterized protein LOC135703547 n=1 Tax=Ochlerotatus camptorhynchus TaxID=644619 RepID=UPI0031CFDF6D